MIWRLVVTESTFINDSLDAGCGQVLDRWRRPPPVRHLSSNGIFACYGRQGMLSFAEAIKQCLNGCSVWQLLHITAILRCFVNVGARRFDKSLASTRCIDPRL